jgi:hypothetical protein
MLRSVPAISTIFLFRAQIGADTTPLDYRVYNMSPSALNIHLKSVLFHKCCRNICVCVPRCVHDTFQLLYYDYKCLRYAYIVFKSLKKHCQMVFSRFLAMTRGKLWGVQNFPDFWLACGPMSSLSVRRRWFDILFEGHIGQSSKRHQYGYVSLLFDVEHSNLVWTCI